MIHGRGGGVWFAGCCPLISSGSGGKESSSWQTVNCFCLSFFLPLFFSFFLLINDLYFCSLSFSFVIPLSDNIHSIGTR